MPHNIDLITTIAVSFGLAMVLGLVAARLRMPPMIGYLLAGVLIGPATPGFVADLELSRQLAEIGVILLMFGVGLHFSMEDLLAVRRIALPGAVAQIAAAVGIAYGAAAIFGVSFALGAFFAGMVLRASELSHRAAAESLPLRDAFSVLFFVSVGMLFDPA